MQIKLSMVRCDEPLCVHRAGDVLRINGALLDLSSVSEGDILPRNAVHCRWIGGDITRKGGELILTLMVPHGRVNPGETVEDKTLDVSENGFLDLGLGDEGQEHEESTIEVDWSQLLSESARRAELRSDALKAVEVEHADLLRRLTGDATIEERDTWAVKETAARAFLLDTATDTQQQMLAMEAEGRQQTVNLLASIIVGKADDFRLLVGLTSKLRAAGRTGVEAATDTSILIEDVPAALAEAQKARAAAREAALSQL